MKLQIALATCLVMTAACSKNKGTPVCNDQATSSFVDAVEAFESNQLIQNSNAVTQEEKTEMANKLKAATDAFNKSSGGVCRTTVITPNSCQSSELKIDTLTQDSIGKYASMNAMLYSGEYENKAALFLDLNNFSVSCGGPNGKPTPIAQEIYDSENVDEMTSALKKHLDLSVDLESYPGSSDGEQNSLFGDGSSGDGNGLNYTEQEIEQIRELLLVISQSKGIQSLMKDVGVKGIEILNPYTNRTTEAYITQETKEGKTVKVGSLKLYVPLYSSEDQIIQALVVEAEEKETPKEPLKEDALKVDEVQPRKHELRE